ncbi:MAG TPA: ferredoxin reductase family protein [Acidimicrobiales bacterium]|nr:ferredoxin reductase family protein [Acidimicrobiales bacterium]
MSSTAARNVAARSRLGAAGDGPGGRRAVRHRPGPAPRQGMATAVLTLAGIGLGATIGTAVTAESKGSLAAAGGWATAAGRLSGLLGAYLMLVMVLLVARLPVLERAVGQDRIVAWHRRIGGWPIVLIGLHAVLITVGYAALDRSGVLHQAYTLLDSYPDVLAATVAFGLLIAVGVSSYRRARRRLRYETWWTVHLYTYLALALAFSHQLANGASFVGHPLARLWWASMWGAVVGTVLLWRIGVPLWRSLYHRLRVVDVRQEGPGVYSVVCAGEHLERLAVSGGQFFQWRFLKPGFWWQAHPYSLSALPRPPYLRVTVKDLGDHSRSLGSLRPGTFVAIEGPYGAFTRHSRTGDRVLLVAAGVGVTPVRALLEDLPAGVDVEVVLRASRPEDLVLRDEVAALVKARRGRLHQLVGDRHTVRTDAAALSTLVPDLHQRDAYVCGPDGFSDRLVAALRAAGTPAEQIHREEFAF